MQCGSAFLTITAALRAQRREVGGAGRLPWLSRRPGEGVVRLGAPGPLHRALQLVLCGWKKQTSISYRVSSFVRSVVICPRLYFYNL